MTELELMPRFGTRNDMPLVYIKLGVLRRTRKGIKKELNNESDPKRKSRLKKILKQIDYLLTI